jgi:RimJ/RimL family protein N-acetyltransferase
MITEVSIGKLNWYVDAFPGPQAMLATASLAAGNTAGHLWEFSQPVGDNMLLLWDKGNNVFYIAGRLVAKATQDVLREFIATQVRAQAMAEGLVRFKVRPMTPALAEGTAMLFADVTLKEHTSLFYGFEQAQPNVPRTPAVDGLAFAMIDRHLLAETHLENIAEVRGEIAWMWPGLDRYYEHGWGVAARAPSRRGEQIICWCTAEYVGPATCGIGVATVPPYEGRGVATAVASRFVEEGLRRGLKPHWECASRNVASVRVAEKVGFTRLETIQYWLGTFDS